MSHAETADIIDIKTISINVTGDTVKLGWDEPVEPNGIVMSYKINITRLDAAKTKVSFSFFISLMEKVLLNF